MPGIHHWHVFYVDLGLNIDTPTEYRSLLEDFCQEWLSILRTKWNLEK